MTVIFKDLAIEVYSKIRKFVNNNKVLTRFAAFAFVAVLSLVVSVVACDITVGYNVEYNGKNIAVVDSRVVFEDAKACVIKNLSGNGGYEAIHTPKLSMTITLGNKLTNAEKLADTLIENTEEICFSSLLKVNGKTVAVAEREKLDKLVDKALCKYYVKGAENNSTFVDNVEIVDGYCRTADVKTDAEVEDALCKVKVKTVSTVTSDSKVKHSTKIVYTSEKVRGYEKVKTDGKNGVKRETAVVETLNGKETAKTVISRKVVKKPVQEVVVKGTAISYASATAKAEARSQGFIRPMNKSDIRQISAYWGDGRNHKAMDFAGNVGAPLFAAKGGKVTFAGYDGNYGYCVVVDHGNGYKTRYAHASALCVKKGEKVTQGQQIAKLGNTGRSTGPHLHFEVIKNGTRVNPAPYIGY